MKATLALRIFFFFTFSFLILSFFSLLANVSERRKYANKHHHNTHFSVLGIIAEKLYTEKREEREKIKMKWMHNMMLNKNYPQIFHFISLLSSFYSYVSHNRTFCVQVDHHHHHHHDRSSFVVMGEYFNSKTQNEWNRYSYNWKWESLSQQIKIELIIPSTTWAREWAWWEIVFTYCVVFVSCRVFFSVVHFSSGVERVKKKQKRGKNGRHSIKFGQHHEIVRN